MESPRKKRVFVLGLDGATFDIIKPLIDEGALPNLAAVMKQGAHAKLNSTILHHSPPAWTTFATGKNPGKHGILGFTRMSPHSYKLDLVYGAHNRAKTMWEVLGETGKKVIVMNIPMTYPPKAVNGILLSGLDTPSTDVQFTHPPDLREEILRVAPDYKINLHLGGYLHNDRRRIKALDIMRSAIRARTKVVLHLMGKYPWDFFTVRFNSPDNVQHQFWSYMDKEHPEHNPDSPEILKNAIKSIYEELDDTVYRICQNIDETNTTLMIMSDHGAGPRLGKSIFVNEWLRNQGYVSKVGEESGNGLTRFVDDMMFTLKGKVLSFLLQTIPPEVKGRLMKLVPFAASKTATYLRFSSINWSKTKAFAGEVEGIRINVKGEYPHGTVDRHDYEKVRTSIIEGFKRLKDPETGQCVFKGVFRREEIFQGAGVEDFADIILKPEDKYYISPKFFRRGDKIPDGFLKKDSHWRKISGSHRQYGIFIVKGADCNHDVQLDPAEIMDIFPTVLYQMGLPIPDDLDGRVVTGAFRPEFVEANPVRFEKMQRYKQDEEEGIYTDEDTSKLIDSLKGLGYM